MGINVKCEHCGQSYELEESLAGQTAECQCGKEIVIPDIVAKKPLTSITTEHEIPETTYTPDGLCPKCKAPVKPDAVICIGCGHNLKLGINVKTKAKVKKAGSFGLAVGVGAAASVISGLIWAGIAILLNLEIGWVAIGVGILTGFSAVMFTEERSARLGLAAAGLALCGLLIGKLITANYFFNRDIDGLVKSDPEFVEDYLTWQAIESKDVPPDLAEWLKNNSPDENDIPEDMLKALTDKIKARIDAMKPDERENFKKEIVTSSLGSISYTSRVISMLSFWDILWFGLALSSAWKIGTGSHEE